MTYPIQADIVPLLRHLALAIQPFAKADFVTLSFHAHLDKAEIRFVPEILITGLAQLLCRTIIFTPQGHHVRLEVSSQKDPETIQVRVISNGSGLADLPEITAGIHLPVAVYPTVQGGTAFELNLQVARIHESPVSWTTPPPSLQKNACERCIYHHALPVSIFEHTEDNRPAYDEAFLQKINAIILTHLDREDFDLCALGKALALSRTQLYRQVKSLTMYSPAQYIRRLRLLRAKEILKNSSTPVGEVGALVGYTDHSHFTRAFKHQFGVDPSHFREVSQKDKA